MISRWNKWDYPVLKAIYELEYQKLILPYVGRAIAITEKQIAQKSGVYLGDLGMALRMLANDGLIRAVRDPRDGHVLDVAGVTPDGLRRLNEWPSGDTLADVFPELLKALADRASDAQEKTILSRAGDVLENVASATIAALIAEVTGLR